jgi:hypothetical protein
VLAARIDLLPPDERRVLRSAAVVGRVFWRGPVSSLLDGESERLDELLGDLEDRELVVSQLSSTLAGEREFVFKHVLTRDVAYGTLSRRDRAQAHAAVAAWIESSTAEREREFSDLLAHHYREAYEGLAADRGTSPDRVEELRQKTLQALLAASAEARTKMLLAKARAFGDSALALAADGHERSLALEALGLCALWDFRGDDAWAQLTAAVDERLAAGTGQGDGFALLCARAVEPPARWTGSMTFSPPEADVARYVEIGFEHAEPESEARVRLLIAESFWPFAFRRDGYTDEEAQAAMAAGNDAVDLALKLGRPDLASAALDGVSATEFIRGLHGRTLATMQRRLEIVERVTDPWEVGDALQTAADTAIFVGRYRDALRWADEGFERARAGPDVWRSALAWRIVSRFKLGDWDDALEDLRLLDETPATTRFGSAGYFHVTAWSCVALLHELRGERSPSERLIARAADEPAGNATVRKVPWLTRVAAHRGSEAEAFRWLERSEEIPWALAMPTVLEATCDIVAELERWDLAEATVTEARAFAERALLEALPLHADRLEGRAALARGKTTHAVDSLTRARNGFAAIGARWEAALASLWLAEAFRAAGDESEAQLAADTALHVFVELGSVRELEHARSLLDGR